MRLKINRTLLTRQQYESAAISPLVSVVHKFTEAGHYKLMVLAGNELNRVGIIDLEVNENAAPSQQNINLEAVAKEKFSKANLIAFRVHPSKAVVFYASSGTQQYSVLAYKMDKGEEVRVFDSRQLQEGDFFVANPLASGVYQFSTSSGAKGELSIKRKVGRALPSQGVVIECTDKAFSPNKVESEFLQPIFFMIKTKKPVRISMQFVKRLEENKPRRTVRKKKKK